MIKAKWIGPEPGAPDYQFLSEIPAGDLTDAEWDRLSEAQQEAVRQARNSTTGQPLYRVKDTAPAPAAADAGTPEPARPSKRARTG